MKLSAILAILSSVLLARGGFAQGLASINGQLAAGGMATQQIGAGPYVFYFEAGGNLVVSIGEQR